MKRYLKYLLFGLVGIVLLGLWTTFVEQGVTKQFEKGRTKFEETTVVIDNSIKNCESDEDCILVYTSCSSDCGVPINSKFKEKLDALTEEVCYNYSGPHVDRACPPKKLKCEKDGNYIWNKRCIAVGISE